MYHIINIDNNDTFRNYIYALVPVGFVVINKAVMMVGKNLIKQLKF